jgi:hypothetical protein
VWLFQDPTSRIHHEGPLELQGARCEVAADYNKRPFVFRLHLARGSEFLFQAKDAVSTIDLKKILSFTVKALFGQNCT